MSKVVEKVKVTNFKDPSKSIEIEAVIDTGATMSVLPMDLIQKLGLEKIDEVNVYADNSVKRKEVYGWVILEIAGRKAVFDVLAENEGAQPLIGTDSIRAVRFSYRAKHEKGYTQSEVSRDAYD